MANEKNTKKTSLNAKKASLNKSQSKTVNNKKTPPAAEQPRLSLSEQVARISGGAYGTSMADRAASSRNNETFDPKEKLSALNSTRGGTPDSSRVVSDGSRKVTGSKENIRINREELRPVAEKSVKSGSGRRTQRRTVTNRRISVGTVIGRIALCLVTAIVFTALAAYTLAFTIAHGPSKTARNKFVLNAKQASATKWIPELVLSGDTVDKILADSQKVVVETVRIEDYGKKPEKDTGADENKDEELVDIWANAKDGILFETVNGSTYKAYVLRIKDPSKVYVATSSTDYASAKYGMTLFDCAERYHCLAAINGGEFLDQGGMGTGAKPMGVTYSRGTNVWNDGYNDRTFIGFDMNNKLIVCEGMTKERADELQIRDAVCFQTNNVLIDSPDGETVNIHYYDGDTGTAQRTAIGQCIDGSVVFIVTDGRSTSSLGATKNDVIDMMYERGVINAAMLDGGSSAMMYYRDYAKKYGIDESTLDEYQKKGMVNKFKAFTEPRYIPTYFVVSGEEAENAE